MKSISTRIQVFLVALTLFCSGKMSAQTFNCYVANDHLSSPTVYEWDVYLQATSPTDFYLRSIQMGFHFDPGFIPAGATITSAYDVSFSDLVSGFSAGPPQWNGTFTCLSTPSSSAGTCVGSPSSSITLFSQAAGPKRIVRMKLISSLPFNCVSPNISMLRPSDTSPQLGILKMSINQWTSSCIANTISNNGTYSTFLPTNGGPTLTNTINNLNQLSVSPVSPASAQLCSGTGTASFAVSATGNGTNTPISYQWLLNGSPLTDGPAFTGTNTSNLSVSNPPVGGILTCQVYQCSPANFATSAPATLAVVQSDDGNACTIDACDPSTGVVTHTPVAINDNNVCTADACDPATGAVTHNPVATDDGNACTTDACDPVTGNITHTTVSISDNDGCTTDACDPATGFVSHTPVNTDDANMCTADACDPSTGAITHTAGPVTDNNVCTTDACDPATGNVSHTPVSVDDNNPCTADNCDPVNGPSHTAIDFSDANLCDIESCDPSTGNISHTLLNTSDQNLCTTDACDPSTGAITHTAGPVTDNNACTTDACDPLTGNVSHTPVNIDDQNGCTADACDPTSGAVTHTSVSVDDNDLCTADACNPSTGAITHTALSTDDNNVCTIDGCDPATGAYHTAVDPNDFNLCTIDACDPVTGIHNTPIPINDNNACTIDACSAGVVTHDAVSTDDGNICTVDGCDPSTGVYHNSIPTDDFNPCTIDACDPSTGDVSHTDATPTINVTAGTISCFGSTTSVVVSGSGGQGQLSGTGTFSGVMAGTWTYTITDAAGCEVNQPISIGQPDKITIDNISSTPTGCTGATGSVSASASGGTGSLSYGWQPGNNSGQTVSNLGAGTYVVTVTDQNSCTTTGSVAVTQSGGGNPNPPGAISGTNVLCKGQCGVVYTVAPIAGALSYTWILPQGMVGSSTSNSISICITSKFKGGFICVKVNNACGTSSSTCMNVLKGSDHPSSPSSIFGPATICANQTATYSISAVPMTSSYVWTVNNGMQILSGQGTTSIVVKAPIGFAGGTIKVLAKNCKGNSGTRNKNIKNGVPGNPGSISGPSPVCKSQTKVYTCGAASNATSYTWAVTGGAQVISGQGTTTVSIKFTTATLSSAVVSVVANGVCSSSAPKTKTVSVTLNCRTSDGVADNSDMNPVYELSAYPNPTSGKATVTFSVTENTKCLMRVMDMLGNVLISESIAAVEGVNSKELSLDKFAKGVYFVSIQAEGNEAQTLRVVVE
jgi:hypothetical protein